MAPAHYELLLAVLAGLVLLLGSALVWATRKDAGSSAARINERLGPLLSGLSRARARAFTLQLLHGSKPGKPGVPLITARRRVLLEGQMAGVLLTLTADEREFTRLTELCRLLSRQWDLLEKADVLAHGADALREPVQSELAELAEVRRQISDLIQDLQ